MKKYLKYLVLTIIVFTTASSCQVDNSFSDINWPVPKISSVSTYKDLLSSTITLKGDFTKVDNVYFGTVVGDNLKVAADGKSLTVDVPRTMDVEGAYIRVTNEYKQSFQTTEKFVPIIPATTVTKVSDIQVGLTFIVEGANVDLLTEVSVDGKVVPVVTKSVSSIIFSVSGLTNLKAGMLVNVSFKSLAKNPIPTVEKVNVIYPFISYEEVVIWDFADGTHKYVGEGTASVKNGNVLGKTANYFSLRAPGYGWDKETGNMISTVVPDVSRLVHPYLTFAVRTPAGSAGYFQMEDQVGHWRHFGYGFNTGGDWVIISIPLEANWEGGGTPFNSGSFKPKLTFKAGNAGTKQDLDIAFVKITEGKYDGSQQIGDALASSTKPAKIAVMDFENAASWPDIKNGSATVASLNFRKNEIAPFYGNQFFTYVDDGTPGNWGAYWGQTISKNMSNTDLTPFTDPYLSLALNSIQGKSQYVIVRMYQYNEQLILVQKFFPDTNGKWNTAQFSLFGTDMENWSDGSTTLGAHYKSLKRFNKDLPLDKIEVIVGRNGSNTIGISIDEVVITEGPRY